MLRVLLCLNCCSAPARAGVIRKPQASSAGKQETAAAAAANINNGNIDPSNFKSLKVFGTDVSRDEPEPRGTRLGELEAALEGIRRGSSAHTLVDADQQQLEVAGEDRPQVVAVARTQSQQVVMGQNRSDSPSTTRIGDYARIEYSPVARSRSSSPASAAKALGPGGEQIIPAASETALGGKEPSKKRRGFESSSISIASQLSSELEKNLTNMLESANSPVPVFGTIGLPLGPLVGASTTEGSTRTEAALTSGSQESLSDGRPKSQATSAGFGEASQSGGAALTAAESADDSPNEADAKKQQEEDRKQQQVTVSPRQSLDTSGRASRSLNSTLSSSITNPTPTPSELSATSSSKRRKLSAKGLLKKLKPGGGKSKKRTSSPMEDSANKQPQQ